MDLNAAQLYNEALKNRQPTRPSNNNQTPTPQSSYAQAYNQAGKEIISKAPPYQGANGNTYQTVRFKDNTLGTINTSTGQLIGGYYTDEQRNRMKEAIQGGTTGKTSNASNLYDMIESELRKGMLKTLQDYTNVTAFSKSNIAESIKLKTRGVADIDNKIADIQAAYNRIRPDLMRKYAHLEPQQREAIINAEEKKLATELNHLYNLREFRLGTIQDILKREIENREMDIKKLQLQYDMYKNALGDLRQAKKTEREIVKETIEMQKDLAQLRYYKQQMLDKNRLNELAIQEKGLKIEEAKNKGGYQYLPDLLKARTNRNNNPTAFTTDVAKQAGLKEGIDYVAGDSFGDKGQYHTAKLIGDPIQLTKKVIDTIGFKTKKGQNRWTYTDKIYIDGKQLNDQNWKTFSDDQKTRAIQEMYKYETDPQFRNFDLFTGKIPYTSTGYIKVGGVDNNIDVNKDNVGKIIDQIKTPSDFINLIETTKDRNLVYKNLSLDKVKQLLEQDKKSGKFELRKYPKLLDIVRDDVDFYDGYMIQLIAKELENLTDEKVIEKVKQLQKNGFNKEEIINILNKSGVLKRKDFQRGWGPFPDGKYYNKLQDLEIIPKGFFDW